MFKKYIIVRGHPVLFSDMILHVDVAGRVEDVESAGFFWISFDYKVQIFNVICIGESTSLAIRSRGEIDRIIIENFLKLNKWPI